MKRLAIIVPYRDREPHLRQFVPHLRNYFTRDKLDRHIDYRVVIVQQEPGLPFNRGALMNIGFLLAEPVADYVCFHDIDFLPIWADYSWADTPTAILWYGAEELPIAPGRSSMVVKHDLDRFDIFGGVVIVPNAAFRQVNGFANDYWGWGSEDTDLKSRFVRSGIALGRRKGTFMPLFQDHNGFRLDGTPTEIAKVNRRLFESRLQNPHLCDDGLSTLRYDEISRSSIPDPDNGAAKWEMVTVRLLGAPNVDQARALSRGAPGGLPRVTVSWDRPPAYPAD